MLSTRGQRLGFFGNVADWFHLAFLVRFSASGVGVHIECGAAPSASANSPAAAPQIPAAEVEAAPSIERVVTVFGQSTFNRLIRCRFSLG